MEKKQQKKRLIKVPPDYKYGVKYVHSKKQIHNNYENNFIKPYCYCCFPLRAASGFVQTRDWGGLSQMMTSNLYSMWRGFSALMSTIKPLSLVTFYLIIPPPGDTKTPTSRAFRFGEKRCRSARRSRREGGATHLCSHLWEVVAPHCGQSGTLQSILTREFGLIGKMMLCVFSHYFII